MAPTISGRIIDTMNVIDSTLLSFAAALGGRLLIGIERGDRVKNRIPRQVADNAKADDQR